MDIGFPLLALLVFSGMLFFRRLKRIKKSRPAIYWVVIILVVFMFFFSCNEFLRRRVGGFAGSYPFVESWDLNISEPELIDIIKDLKKEDPSLQPPHDTVLTYGRESYWYYIDFYYPDTKEKVHTWTRSAIDTTITTFAFDALSYYDDKMDYRHINRDFWYWANKKQIWKFEKRIVDRLKEKVDKRNKNGR